MALLPIGLLSVYSYQIASNSVMSIIRAEDIAQTGGMAQQLQQDMGRSIALAEAFAAAPGTKSALEQDDQLLIVTRLKAIALSVAALERTAIADANGQIRYSYPLPEENEPRDASTESVIATVVSTGKPNISAVQKGQSDNVVVHVVAPLSGTGNLTGGAIVLDYRASEIEKWLTAVNLPSGSSLFVLDHRGNVVARAGATLSPHDGTLTYAALPAVQRALQGTLHTSEYTDPYLHESMVATFLPVAVGRGTWVIVAEKPTALAYRDLWNVRKNIAIAGGALTLVTLFIIVLLAHTQAKNIRLNRELTEKNLQLNETASIVQTSNDAIVGFLVDGRIRTWNTSAEKMFGSSAKETIGTSVSVIIPQEKTDEFASVLAKVNAGETIQNFETVRLKKDGTLVPVSVTLSPIRDDHGKVVAVSSIDRDITERKKIEQMKDDFISFVSHQLQAPIIAIRWTLESLTDGDFGAIPEPMKAPLEQIRTTNAHNSHLISDILNASRIDRGVIAVESKATPLKDVVERTLRDYRVAISKAELTLTVEADTPITVQVDMEKMAEAVTNSISNAIKHTKKGGITIRTYKDEAFGYVDVIDTGAGMPADIIQKLFTRTGILGNSSVAEKSAGLGLYIARHFMQIQGGEIDVKSTPGQGTTFTYRIPLAKATEGM